MSSALFGLLSSAAQRVSIAAMNVIRVTGTTFVLALSLTSAACSSSGSGSKSSGSSLGEDGGSPADAGATGPVSTCTASDEGDGCHDTSCPCTLLTPDQVSAAVGVTVGAPDDGTGKGGDPHNCVWTYKAPAPSTDKLTVYLTTNIEPPSFDGTCGGKPSNGVTTTPVSDVGDAACYTVIAEGIGTDLTFQKNCWAYTVSISATGTLKSMFTTDTIEADEKTLAQEVASMY